MKTKVLPRSFYKRDSRIVAPELLNKLLVHGNRVGRIVEVEAYAGSEDPGSHAYRGPTKRNATMFEKGGLLYVYFTYGMHWCANAVCGKTGEGVAVLLRAVAPLNGLDEMRIARGTPRKDTDLCSGPAKLCQAFGLDGRYDGADLVAGDRMVQICDDGAEPPAVAAVGPRIGLSAGTDSPWRWWVHGDPNVSKIPRMHS